MHKTMIALAAGALGLVLLLAVNSLANATLRSKRLDLTKDRLYTLSEGSTRIVESIDEPINLYFYCSEDAATKIASVQRYATRVREMLEEFALRSDGKIALESIDPEPFSEAEERASAEGLQAIPLQTGESLFLGLVGSNAVGETEVIPFFDPSKERFLEYDLAKLLYTLTHVEKGVVGVISSLPIQGGPPSPMQQRPAAPWQIITQTQEFFETRFLPSSVTEIPDDVRVLVIVHPKNLGDATLYAIDQYVLGGGNTLVFVDPHCDADTAGADPMDPMSGMGKSKASGLPKLLRSWGLELVADKFVGDRGNALPVEVGTPLRPRRVNFVGFVELGSRDLDADDPTTSLLQALRFGIPGALRPLPGATTTFHPLAHSSEDAMLVDRSAIQYVPDPEEILRTFVPDMQRFTLAARVTGPASSAFPDGSPAKLPEDGSPADEDPEGSTDEGRAAHRAEGDVNLIVVGDCDVLADRFWVQKQSFAGATLISKTADNGDFFANCVENLAGGENLIAIRAAGEYQRPFERVEELRREAEAAYLQEKRELETKQQEIDGEINNLIRSATPGSTQVILTKEQQEQLESMREEREEIRRRLRDVEYGLRKDIERLGTKVKLANILLVPALVGLAALGLGVFRSARAKSSRRSS